MPLTGDHMGIVVADLAESIAFYREYFDMTVVSRLTTDGAAFGPLLGVDGEAEASIAFLETSDGFTLELEEHEAAETNLNTVGEPTAVGYPHVCFAVEDIQATYEAMRDEVPFVSAPGSATDSGATIVYCRDPSGNLVELIEPASDADS